MTNFDAHSSWLSNFSDRQPLRNHPAHVAERALKLGEVTNPTDPHLTKVAHALWIVHGMTGRRKCLGDSAVNQQAESVPHSILCVVLLGLPVAKGKALRFAGSLSRAAESDSFNSSQEQRTAGSPSVAFTRRPVADGVVDRRLA
jgi:hypothetical protein